MNLTKILIAIVILAVLVVLARIFLKPSELKWVISPSPDCNEMLINATVKGGTEIYEYSIDNGKNFYSSETGVLSIPIEREGEYFIQVTDGENFIMDTLTVPCQFKSMDKDPCLEDNVNATAKGYRERDVDASDGRIKVTMQGGCPPYSIYLNDKLNKSGIEGNSYTIKNLAPGNYKIRIESKLKNNYLDIPNKIWVGKYKPAAPKTTKEKLEKRINEYIESNFDYDMGIKIEGWFADENTSTDSYMIDLTGDQNQMTIYKYLQRLNYQSDIIKSIEITNITFDKNNDILTFSVTETPK